MVESDEIPAAVFEYEAVAAHLARSAVVGKAHLRAITKGLLQEREHWQRRQNRDRREWLQPKLGQEKGGFLILQNAPCRLDEQVYSVRTLLDLEVCEQRI